VRWPAGRRRTKQEIFSSLLAEIYSPIRLAVGNGSGRLPLVLPQHADHHRPEDSILLAVDQQLGEGRSAVAPELADPVVESTSRPGLHDLFFLPTSYRALVLSRSSDRRVDRLDVFAYG
jgi:hypothetical protein